MPAPRKPADMRTLFGWLAALLCVVSVAFAARYGYKGADTEVDGLISGIVFGLIALCACLFDAAAVRLWLMRHRIGAIAIGVIAATALIVTFTNSLGAIASRSDIAQAERNRTKADEADSRAELARITREREGLAFAPTTDDAVKAARDAVFTAEHIRLAECANGDPKQRGPNCRASPLLSLPASSTSSKPCAATPVSPSKLEPIRGSIAWTSSWRMLEPSQRTFIRKCGRNSRSL
jgi:hypothetical protein